MHLVIRSAFLAVLGVIFVGSLALAANHTVQMLDTQFVPQTLTIVVDDVVTWKNDGFLIHTSTSGNPCSADGKWGSPGMMPGQSFTPAVNPFTVPGTYTYYCIPHCLIGMTGTIIVEAPVSTERTTWGAIKALYFGDPR